MTAVRSAVDTTTPAEEAFNLRLALLLAAAMFVLVVDTSLMNVSISAVVTDLGTTVSGVQSAIALEALVSAAFILISSKVGDLIGRKKAYVLGLLGLRGRRAGDGPRPGPARGHHLLGDPRRPRRVAPAAVDAVADPRQLRGRGPEAGLRAGRRVGGHRRRDRAAARRVHHDVPVVARRLPARAGRHRGRPVGHPADPRRAVHRVRAGIDLVGAVFSVLGMGGIVLGILVWQEGGEAVGALLAIGAVSLAPAGLVAGPSQARRAS